VSPQTTDYNEPVGTFFAYPGGYPGIKKYQPARLGGRQPPNDTTNAVVDLMTRARRFSNQGIKEKRHELEHRIIKLMDLREQLEQERDDIVQQAWGGTLFELPDFDDDRFADSLRIQNIVEAIDDVFFDRDPDGVQRDLTVNAGKVALSDFYVDEPEEIFLTLMY
ncbi:MAG: hypothetical protein AAGM67_11595, partial [Bacteroidota bacterium]